MAKTPSQAKLLELGGAIRLKIPENFINLKQKIESWERLMNTLRADDNAKKEIMRLAIEARDLTIITSQITIDFKHWTDFERYKGDISLFKDLDEQTEALILEQFKLDKRPSKEELQGDLSDLENISNRNNLDSSSSSDLVNQQDQRLIIDCLRKKKEKKSFYQK